MTIYFSGHGFKYELEGICKLFLPLVRFNHVFNDEKTGDDEYIYTRLKKSKQGEKALLWVIVKLSGKDSIRAHTIISGNVQNFNNECERKLCILLHGLLKRLTGISPSWGILTGVRPVSILQKLRKSGMTDSEITNYFKEKYLVSDEKLSLSFLTADTQYPLLKNMPAHSYSLYVAIPFCVSRCSYCSFVSHAIDRPKATDKIEEYLVLLCRELKKTAEIAQRCSLRLDTIYIGGGTPTALSASQLEKITDAIAEFFPVKEAREYTIEAGRADTITKEKLLVIKNAGCKRISINPQTFNDEVLQKIGRKHTAKQAEECFELAKSVGFESINMDFIAGLPTDTLKSFEKSIDRAIELSPENITVHSLSIKRSAELFSEEGIAQYAKSGITADMTEYARKKIINAGYFPYYLYRQKNTVGNLENVGYAKKGTESLYNIYIMEELQTILSCGAGGVTKLVGAGNPPIRRIFNFKYHFEYISRFDEILKKKDEVISFYE